MNEFELINDQTIPELKTRARLYRHVAAGAELLSMENDDENKVFGITFRTPPTDSTGVPHIMEHAVLGGSEKYPVKEPFVELMKGSMATSFNEMKGAYSSPDNLVGTYSTMSLFPNHPYGFDSGGDPRVIPNLSYAQFKAFHETDYHPSNARIYFYGDDAPEERLQRMAAYLEGYQSRQVNSEAPLKAPFNEAR